MKKTIVGLLLCAGWTLAGAQEAGPAEQVRVTPARDVIALPLQLHNVWYDEFDAVAGEYQLSDGGRMVLGMWGNRMYASISGMGKVPLVARGPFDFVGAQKQFRIQVDETPDAAGHLNATVLLAAQPLLGQAGTGDHIRLVARR